MQYLSIVIADSHLEYANGVASFLREQPSLRHAAVRQFTRLEHVEAYFQHESDGCMIVIACTNWSEHIRQLNLPKRCCLIELTDEEEAMDEHAFYRYQSLELLLSRLRAWTSSNEPGSGAKAGSGCKTEVIAVYAASGGSGKTTTAANLAYHLSRRDQHVLYLNLEHVPSLEAAAGKEEGEFGNLVYMLKHHPERFQDNLRRFFIRHPDLACDSIPTPAYADELHELNADDLKQFIHSMKKLNIYDYVILDLPSVWEPRIISLFQQSDHIFWLLLDQVHCRLKTVHLLRQFYRANDEMHDEVARKIRFVLNQALNELCNDYSQHGIRLCGRLPYIPRWKATAGTDEYLNEPAFFGPLLRLMPKPSDPKLLEQTGGSADGNFI